MADATSSSAPHPHRETVKETVMSVILAFALAFVFRGFVVEAFVIPTGSMAPTLLGAHERFRSSSTGYEWTVMPWYNAPGTSPTSPPAPVRNQVGPNGEPMSVHDPMSGTKVTSANKRLRAGDRILVLKYLYAIRQPTPFDVIVFKNPYSPTENFIKRLIGTPGNEIALVDGDVFARPGEGEFPPTAATSWHLTDWSIQRKPEHVQRAVWQPVFNSAWAPADPWPIGFANPWTTPDKNAWEINGRRSYRYDGAEPTTLEWDDRARFGSPDPKMPEAWQRWSLTERYPYNERNRPVTARNATPYDPRWTVDALKPYINVSDLALAAAIEPDASGMRVVASLISRGHEYEGVIDTDGTASVRMRPLGEEAWTVLDSRKGDPISAGRATPVEFWHADQALWLLVDGDVVAGGPELGAYDWQPAERIRQTAGRSLNEVLRGDPGAGITRARALEKLTGSRPEVTWRFEGGAFTLHRVALARDLHYRARLMQDSTEPARATHPDHRLVLDDDQFFACGDNSPQSHDGRTWNRVDPWVRLIEPEAGIVPRKFLLGKAFFVYFPAAHKDAPVIPFVPDFGNLRFIN